MDTAVTRILDANVNRAREALRVIEDYARFECDDADAAAAVKHCRHRLRRIVELVGGDALLAARDITNDVGTTIKTGGELERAASADVVRAAFARAQEATRVLGEYAKLVSAQAAALAEEIRYDTYELEQRVILRGDIRARLRNVRLYVLVTADLCSAEWPAAAEAALRGGATCVQLREKSLPDGELLRRARQLRELATQYDALCMINDRPDIARLAGADGVHVGQGDLGVAEARRVAGAQMLVGKSTHNPEQFAAALVEQPDYIAVGPMYPTSTKPQGHVAGPELLAHARERTELPLVAIGGIDAENAGALLAGGASCVAVCSAIIGARNVEAAARAFGGV